MPPIFNALANILPLRAPRQMPGIDAERVVTQVHDYSP